MAYTKPPEKLHESLLQLRAALKFYDATPKERALRFLAVVKAFEVATEYAWKALKERVEAEGMETLSPKDAVRVAARLGIISSAEAWIRFINTRNSSVHDYFGISEKRFVEITRQFLKEAHTVFPK